MHLFLRSDLGSRVVEMTYSVPKTKLYSSISYIFVDSTEVKIETAPASI